MADAEALTAEQFIAALPHARALGVRAVSMSAGVAVIELDYDCRLVGDPATGVLSGGAVSALMDTAGGAAVMSHPDIHGATATLNLRIDYLRPARPERTIRAEAVCHHVTRSVAFVRATATDGAEDPVATATGVFTAADG